jgi:hypothetical protein
VVGQRWGGKAGQDLGGTGKETTDGLRGVVNEGRELARGDGGVTYSLLLASLQAQLMWNCRRIHAGP